LVLFTVLACTSEPKFPPPPAVLGTAATVSESPAQVLQRQTFDWVLARRWTIDKALALVVETDAAPLPIVRAFHSGPVLGVIRCDATCVGALKTVLPDGAERTSSSEFYARRSTNASTAWLSISAGSRRSTPRRPR